MALGTPVAAAAAYSAASGTTVSPAYPAGILATDVVLLFVGQKPTAVGGGTVTTPTGWTLRDELTNAGGYTAQGADTGNTNLRVYSWNTPVAGQTGNLAVTIGGNDVTWAFMVRIPKGSGAAEFGSADGQRTTTPTSPMSIALTNGATATNFQTGDRAIWAMCIPTDVTTPNQFSVQSVTATGATFGTATELNEPDSTTGNDIGGYSAWAAVTAGSSTTAPTVTATVGGTLTNVRGPVVLLRVREAAPPPTQTLTPSLYTNTQTFHNPTVSVGAVTLTPALYTNDQTFYSPDVTQSGGTQTLTPALYTNTQEFFSPTVGRSNTLTPGLYTNTQTFFSPTVSATYALTPGLYSNTQSFFAPAVTASKTLTPAKYDNTQTFYAAVITQTGGPQTLLPGLYSNAQTFYAPTVGTTYSLAPARYDNAQTFFAPSVAASYALTPSLVTNAQTFYAPTVGRGPVTLQPSLYTNDQTFYAPTVGRGTVTLQPALVTNAQTFYAPTVIQVGGNQTLTPGLVTNAQTFYSATVTPGAVTLLPQGYVDDGYVDGGYVGPNTFSTQVFYAATVLATKTLAPPLVTNASTFFAPTVALESFLITKAQALELYKVWLLHGLGASPLVVVGSTSRTAGEVTQTVSQSGATVTISTTATPSALVGDPGTMIEELALLHGLGADLVVTASSRAAGAVSQTLATSGSTTTVARV